MARKFLVPLALIALLSGCVSDYAYRGGSGDYYYGRPSVSVYGAPYSSLGYGYPGGWYGHVGYGVGYYGGPYRHSPWYGGARWASYPYGYYGYSSFHPGYPGYYRPYHRPHGSYKPQRPPHGGRDDDRGPGDGTVGPPRPHPRPDGTNLTPEYALERLRPGASRQREAMPSRAGVMSAPVGRPSSGEAPRAVPRPQQEYRAAQVQRAPAAAPVRSAPPPRPARESRPARPMDSARDVRDID